METAVDRLQRFQLPRDEWMDQSDHEWVLVLRGVPVLRCRTPIGLWISVKGIIYCFRPIDATGSSALIPIREPCGSPCTGML